MKKRMIKSPSIEFSMFLLLLPFLLFFVTACGRSQKLTKIEVTVDPRVELMSTVCRLAGYDEYNMGSYPAYYKIVGDYFKDFENHQAVQIAKKIRETNDIAFNAPIGLATYLKDVETMETKIPFTSIPEDLDQRWDTEIAATFTSALKEFWIDSDFKGFMETNQAIYDTAISRFEVLMEKHDLINWFSDYFGVKQGNQFYQILGLQNGGANYASRATTEKGEKQIFSTIGCWIQDEDRLPEFPDDIMATVVHEFCHSYTNPIVDQFIIELEQAGKQIFPHVEEKMTGMAYTNWEVMLYEYFVRACVIRYVTIEQGDEAGRKQAEKDIKRGFVGLDRLAELLINYESDRSKYPSFTDFVPQIVDFLESYTMQIEQDLTDAKKKIQEKWDKLKKDGPQIVKMIPENGSLSVSPDLQEIKIFFDRKMNPDSYSVMYGQGEAGIFPEQSATPHYDETNTIYIIPVNLKPNHNYKFGLNSFRATGFQDTSGLGLYPVVVKFETGSK